MLTILRPALVSFCCLTVVTGVAYPLVVTGIAAIAFPKEANGSLIQHDGKTVGSTLIAQPFTDAKYFWSRPSAANYDGTAGSGSNLGPTNPALGEAVASRIQALRAGDSQLASAVPVDLVTASGSGLDPHISVGAAEAQLARVAHARGMSPSDVQRVVEANTEQRTAGILGEPRVNVLRLNLALDHHLDEASNAATTKSDDYLGYRWRGFAPDPK